MKWSIQIVSPATHTTSATSVLVHFDKGRYLFNCGEGVQRLSFENKLRLSRLGNIFLTRVHWEAMGGLPGMLLTLADGGTQNLRVSGGPNLAHALAATRHFILRGNMGVSANEMRSPNDVFQDDNLKVRAVHVYPDHYTPQAQELAIDESKDMQTRHQLIARAFGKPQAEQQTGRRKTPLVQQKKGYYKKCSGGEIEQRLADEPGQKRARSPEQRTRQISETSLPAATPTEAALCYICEGPEVPGKFDVKAAQALGLRPGPLYGRLQRGETVEGPNGPIRPEQCVGATRPGRVFAIIECPSPAYIESVTNNQQLLALQGSERLLVVVHALGAGVATDARYRQWAGGFAKHVQHMVSAPEVVPDGNPFQRHLRVQAAMAAVDPLAYVLPMSSGTAELPLDAFLQGKNVVRAQSLLRFEVEPRPRLVTDDVPELRTPEAMLASAQAGTLYGGEPNDETPATSPAEMQGRESDLVVCPIGTGSSVPSIYRNVSANILDVPGYGGVVLDCGESTVAQLKRFLGHQRLNPHNRRIPKTFEQFVQSLRLLYISHMHADHHLGAILLLHEWARLSEPSRRLTVLAPARFHAWLNDFAGVQPLGLERIDFIDCQDARIDGRSSAARALLGQAKAALGLTELATCGVVHCPWAYGLAMTHQSGWRLVYSGDTRPCKSLVDLGRRTPVTVLLHEATHSDDLLEDAIAKRHTTVSEAVAMAVAMQAENLLMTHFSQRCLALPRWSASAICSASVPRLGPLVDGPAPMDYEGTQELLGNLNIASAFDMSAYGPADIARYRKNAARLRQVLRNEIRALAAEEAEDADEEDPKSPPKKTTANKLQK